MFQVQVTQENAKAHLDIQDPFLQLKTTDLAVQISSEPLRLQIDTPAAELSIDNYPSNYSRGMKNNMDFDRDNAKKGMQTLYEAIGRMAREGVMMSKIENKGQPLAQLAKAAVASKEPEINIASVVLPTVKVSTHEVKVQVQPGQLRIRFINGTTTGNLERGTVGLTMMQYPQVDFRFTNRSSNINLEA